MSAPAHVQAAVDAEIARGYLDRVNGYVDHVLHAARVAGYAGMTVASTEYEYTRKIALRAVTYALDAGAMPPLEYVGHGVQGAVVCDARGRAYKVPHDGVDRSEIESEAAWLRAATPVLGPAVAQFIDYRSDTGVLVRECVSGRSAHYVNDDVERACIDIMTEMGSAPECSGDAFVWVEGRGLVLVDAGFPATHAHVLDRAAIEAMYGGST